MKSRILIVDDEKNIREGLSEGLALEGFDIASADNGGEAWARFLKGDIDLVITDLAMPGFDGGELLRKINAESPGLPVIILTGHGSVESAVKAMREGAYDFLTKPVNLDHLAMLVKRALAGRDLERRHHQLEEEMEKAKQFKAMIGGSAPMRRVFDTISRAAPARASILITGESGVGKELVAAAIHALSPRKDKPMITVHCAALAASLLESELFGHEKGAFTGAVSRARGRFELANEGTLFLDEIGEIDQNIQIKLLRVLQEKKFERVGGEETIEVDVRVVAATNKDLKAETEKGTFREDLYFRLNVVNIHVPPLRERKDDIPLLLSAFLKELAAENGKVIEGINDKARSAIYRYDWPGNVRELRNCVESAVVMARGPVITEEDLPPALRSFDAGAGGLGGGQGGPEGFVQVPLGASMDAAERLIVRETLSYCKGNKSRAADILGLARKTLHRKLSAWGEGDGEEGE